MKRVNCIPPARSAAALCGSPRPAGKLGAAPGQSGLLSALIAFVLVNGVAIGQGQLAVAGQSGAVQSSTDAQLPALDACISRLDPELDIGYDRIAARCPELAKQLDHGAWAPWLPRGWKEPGNDLSAGGLREFRELVQRESEASAAQGAPDIRHLKGVLDGLAGPNTEGW